MKKLLVVLFVFLVGSSPTLAQSGAPVKQSGNVTPNQVPWWVTSGVIGGGVSAADSPVTSFGVTNNGGNGICVNSNRVTAPGRNTLCLGTQTNGPGVISLQNYGTATPQTLQFVINGAVINFPSSGGNFIFGQGSFTAGHVPCFVSTASIIQDCGLVLSSGVVTGGAWQGTPIALGFGGTGATSAAGARTNLGLGTLALQDAGNVNITGGTITGSTTWGGVTIPITAGGTGATSAAGARTALGLGTIATQNSNAAAITGGTITGMPNPSASSDVATKNYVDATATGLHIQTAVRLATAAILSNTPTYANGASGVGATLTAGTNGALTVDGTAVSVNDRVLIKNQVSQFQNGAYAVTAVGDGSNPYVLTRATDFDTSAEMLAGSYFLVTAGSANNGVSFVLQNTVTTVGTTAAVFTQFSSTSVSSLGGASGPITLGPGLTVPGNTLTLSSTQALGGTGVARPLQNKLDETVSFKDYGAVGNGSTPDDSAFQLALNAIDGAAGGRLFIPPVSTFYVLSGPLTCACNNTQIVGGGYASQLGKTTTTGDLFQISGPANTDLSNFSVNAGTGATSGVLFNFTNSGVNTGNIRISDMNLTGGSTHISFSGGQNTLISRSIFTFFTGNGIQFTSAYAGTNIISDVNMGTAATGAQINNGFGILVLSGDGFNWTNINIGGLATGIGIIPPAGTYVANLFAVNVLVDNVERVVGGNGWTFDGSVAPVARINLTNCWASGSVGDGFLINSVSDITFTNCRGLDNVGSGYNFTGTNTGIRIVGSVAEGNSKLASGTYDGFRFGAGSSHVNMTGNRSGLSSGLFIPNTQKYGIDFLSLTIDFAILQGNDLSGNVTSGYNGIPLGSGNVFVNNIGMNPGGGNVLTVTASPFTYVAGPRPETVYVQGGSVTQMVTQGVQAATTSNTSVNLGPNESVRISYTSPPDVTTAIH